jgi:hypothetical protein
MYRGSGIETEGVLWCITACSVSLVRATFWRQPTKKKKTNRTPFLFIFTFFLGEKPYFTTTFLNSQRRRQTWEGTLFFFFFLLVVRQRPPAGWPRSR